MMHNSERPQLEWIRDRSFKQGGIVVTVLKLPLRRPKFRFEVGCQGPEDKVFRQFSVFSEGQGKLTFKHDWDPEVAKILVAQALEYISGELQAAEDERVEGMAYREAKDIAKDKPRQHAGLKQLAKRDKFLHAIKTAGKP